ncbi:citrate transporter family protein [Clostridioides difficile CD160]|nr:citrate transporter family protein [Clostridioides difficile CD160]
MDIIALILFLGVIVLAFVRKNNAGILALAVGVIAVRIFGMDEKELYGAISNSMFTTLVGITLLFAIVNSTGALKLVAEKIVAVSGKRVWLIPIAVFIAGFIVAGVGPGAIPALAIIPAMAVPVAITVGYNPVMLALIGECGLMAGRMTPITPEGQIITTVAESVGIENVMPAILACQTLSTIVFSIVLFIIFKGYKLKKPINIIDSKNIEKFNVKQIISLISILVMIAFIIFFDMNVGLAAFSVSAILLLFNIAEDGECIKAIPWSTIVMVLGVGAMMTIVDAAGGIDLMSNALSSLMNSKTATPIMSISAGLMSMVSSALAVVYPTMMPMCVDIAKSVGGVDPLALIAAVGVGGSLAGVSPLSTGGALILAAMGSSKKDFNKEEQNKVFIQLFVMSAVGLLVIAVVSVLFFNGIAHIMH